MQVRSFVWS